MTLDSVGTKQEPTPTGTGADVTNMVMADLMARREAGTKKYGTPLKCENGRNPMVDAYQEALDMALYLRQGIEEGYGPPKPPDESNEPLVPRGISNITLTSDITVRPIQKMGGDHMVVAAAKVSTTGAEAANYTAASCVDSNAGLINYLMQHRHGTPFEHSAMTFFVHAPIFVWREWHRHRIGFSYNEESARYKKLEPVFWIPSEDRKITPAKDHTSARPHFLKGELSDILFIRKALTRVYHTAYSTYDYMIKLGYAKEVCRAVLPVGIYSSCWVTCNPRSLMAFLSLRTHDLGAKFVSYPQAEIECAARLAEKFLEEGWPLTYRAFVNNGRVGP